jgi:hypothetical protein
MPRKLFLTNRKTFSADTDDIDLTADVPIGALNIAFDCLQNGATAPTLANLIEVINDVYVKDGGAAFTDIDFTELFVLNELLLAHRPFKLLGGGDNYAAYLDAVKVPCNLPAGSKGRFQIKCTYTGHATVDTIALTITAEQGPVIGALKGLITGRCAFKQFAKTPSATGWTEESKVALPTKGRLLALLAYGTTIPGTTTMVTSASLYESKITVGGVDYRYYNIAERFADVEKLSEDSTLLAILDNYILYDFRDDPIDLAGIVKFEWNAGTADAVRLVAVVDEPV